MKKVNKKLYLLYVLLIVANTYFSQQDMTLYYMPVQQSQVHANAAFIPTAKLNLAVAPLMPPFIFPSMYINLSNSGFKLSDAIGQNSKGQTVVDLDNMLSKLKANNYLSAAVQVDVASFGFKLKKNYFSFCASEKGEMTLKYPKDFMNVLINGNGASRIIGVEQNFSFALNAIHYTDLSFGFSRSFKEDKLTLGGRLKYLIGHENIFTKTSDISLTTSNQNFDITAKSNIEIYTTGLDSTTRGKFFDQKNKGLGIDLGFNYKLTEKLEISASVNDLGYIKWTEGTKNYVSKNPGASLTFSGVDLKDFVNDSTNIDVSFKQTLDSVAKELGVISNTKAYKSMLTTKAYAGAKYKLSEKMNLGSVLYMQIGNHHVNPALCLSLNAKLAKTLMGSVSYSVMNKSYANVGLGVVFNPGIFQWYLATDNIFGLFLVDKYKMANKSVLVPAYTKTLNIRFGFNFTIGKNSSDETK